MEQKRKVIRVSACVIVKNEAENLPRWLAGMRRVADEMIVVDTGSTDDTAAIAAAAGARVISFPWRDDFAAAKNFALDQARGRWIIFPDADEYFTEASLERIPQLLRQGDRDNSVGGYLCRLVNIDKDDGGRVSSVTTQVRIFRHLRQLRYQGSVHETLAIPRGKKLLLVPDITIHHTGYSREIVREKLQRNLALLEKNRKEHKHQDDVQEKLYYMDIYYGLQEYEKAIACAKEIIEDRKATETMRTRCYETWASACIEGHFPADEIEASLNAAIAARPEEAEFLLMKGLWLYEQQDYLQAEALLRQGLALHENMQQVQQKRYQTGDIREVNLSLLEDNAERLLPHTWWRLGSLAELQRKGEDALACYEAGLRLQPRHARMLQAYWRLICAAGIDDVDRIQILRRLYRAEDVAWLAEQLSGLGAGRVYLYFARAAGVPLDTVAAQLAAGRADAAAEQAADCLDTACRFGLWAEASGAGGLDALLGNLPLRWQRVRSDYQAGRRTPEVHALQRLEREMQTILSRRMR